MWDGIDLLIIGGDFQVRRGWVDGKTDLISSGSPQLLRPQHHVRPPKIPSDR